MFLFTAVILAARSLEPKVSHTWVASIGNGTMSGIKYSHMATIANLGGGRIAVAFQATTSIEGANDQHVRFTTSSDSGTSWEQSRVVVGDPSGKAQAIWGPVLHYDPATDTLFLFYSAAVAPNATYHVGGEVRSIVSKDFGRTWSADYNVLLAYGNESKVTANRLAVVVLAAPPASNQLHLSSNLSEPAPAASAASAAAAPPPPPRNARWLLPFWYEGAPPTGAASVLASDDGGATWHPHGFIHGSPKDGPENSIKLIENSVAPLPSGKGVLQIFRAGKGTLFGCTSADVGGVEWPKPALATTIPNPSAKASIFARDDAKGIVLSYNPSTKLRSPLAVAQSADGSPGSFVHHATLEDDDKRSFAYPTSVQVADKIYTVYSVYDPHATAPHVHKWWGIRLAVVDVD